MYVSKVYICTVDPWSQFDGFMILAITKYEVKSKSLNQSSNLLHKSEAAHAFLLSKIWTYGRGSAF